MGQNSDRGLTGLSSWCKQGWHSLWRLLGEFFPLLFLASRSTSFLISRSLSSKPITSSQVLLRLLTLQFFLLFSSSTLPLPANNPGYSPYHKVSWSAALTPSATIIHFCQVNEHIHRFHRSGHRNTGGRKGNILLPTTVTITFFLPVSFHLVILL